MCSPASPSPSSSCPCPEGRGCHEVTGEAPAELQEASKMPNPRPTSQQQHVDALRGASKLAVAATVGVTELVQELHRTIASGPLVLGRPLAGPAKALTDLVY